MARIASPAPPAVRLPGRRAALHARANAPILLTRCPRVIRVSDVPPGRIAGREPDGVFHVLRGREGGAAFRAGGLAVTSIRLCEYVERPGGGGRRGPYSLITAVVETDAGAAEMVYDEGYRGRGALEDAGRFLVGHLGASALVERAAVALASRSLRGEEGPEPPPNG